MKHKIIKYIFAVFLCTFIGCCFSSCTEEPDSNKSPKQRLILIYAVAANNLEKNLQYDIDEILEVTPQLNLVNNRLLLYAVDRSGKCLLKELKYNSKYNKGEFVTIAEFPDLPLSTCPERINEVIEYVNKNYDYPKKGLILWSHATGWLPWSGGNTPPTSTVQTYSFGSDQYDGKVYQTDINDLANAIPENVFDFIWFDCCYMANVETAYELREKCDFIVGYVMEISEYGMPYDLTMPYLLKNDADLYSAADTLFNYYNNDYQSTPITVSIIKTDKLSYLASAAKKVFSTAKAPQFLSGIQNYSRISGSPFYDLGQYLKSYSNLKTETVEELNFALNQTVIFKKISDRDFNNRPINQVNFSGLSIHNYVEADNFYENYYKNLEWFKATR